MVGAYSMTTQVLNDGTKDSVLDRKQLKIYTDHYMMYASPNLTDSFANFGIGQYEIKNGQLYEYVFYRAETGEIKDTVSLSIEKTVDGYRQVIESFPIQGKNYRLTEEYRTVGTGEKSPLDGAWKQIKNVYINSKGDSSVNNNPLEYKTFQSGYFIWAITVKDSANKKTSVFGYGPFVMDGKNKSKETVVNTTFASGLLGKTYEVEIEYPSADTYKQTITFAKGEKSIEIYQKLK